jgi:N-methylhydantoinase A/oxoprolinase/acetone carboxylase beta subunit
VLVDIRLAMVAAGPKPRPAAATGGHLEGSTRTVIFDGERVETAVMRGEPTAGIRAVGPVVFELPEATLVLPPGWNAEVDDAGTIVARFQADEMRAQGAAR